MRVTSIGIVAGIIGTLALAVFNSSFAAEPRKSSTDSRQRLILAPATRDRILAEMRMMLESVGGIVRGLATNDPSTAEKAARASGMKHAADADPQLHALLPHQFLELGMHTHRGFDMLADQIQAGGSHTDILRGLATLTGNCVACHAIYRLDDAH